MVYLWKKRTRVHWKKCISYVLLCCLIASTALAAQMPSVQGAEAQTVTSIEYYSPNDGPVLQESGVGSASFGFVMPVFNGGQAVWEDVAADVSVEVKVGDVWTDIDQLNEFAYNSNWGHWLDGGFTGYWFTLSESTLLRLISKANPNVSLEYSLEFTNLSTTTITAMTPTQGPEITAGVTGGAGFTYPTFNHDATIQYAQVASDLMLFAWSDASQTWVDLNNNATSGWIYDQNFGQFYDGGGGYWFQVEQTSYFRLQSKSSPNVYLDYTVFYNAPERTEYRLSADETTFQAGESGA